MENALERQYWHPNYKYSNYQKEQKLYWTVNDPVRQMKLSYDSKKTTTTKKEGKRGNLNSTVIAKTTLPFRPIFFLMPSKKKNTTVLKHALFASLKLSQDCVYSIIDVRTEIACMLPFLKFDCIAKQNYLSSKHTQTFKGADPALGNLCMPLKRFTGQFIVIEICSLCSLRV